MGDAFWRAVKGELRGIGLSWWEENRDSIAELGKEEAEEIFRGLRRGDITAAKLAIVSHMSRDEWKAYVAKTTSTLGRIATRRARMLESLGDLGAKAAEAIGRAALQRFQP
jgi:hypothetical protein